MPIQMRICECRLYAHTRIQHRTWRTRADRTRRGSLGQLGLRPTSADDTRKGSPNQPPKASLGVVVRKLDDVLVEAIDRDHSTFEDLRRHVLGRVTR